MSSTPNTPERTFEFYFNPATADRFGSVEFPMAPDPVTHEGWLRVSTARRDVATQVWNALSPTRAIDRNPHVFDRPAIESRFQRRVDQVPQTQQAVDEIVRAIEKGLSNVVFDVRPRSSIQTQTEMAA